MPFRIAVLGDIVGTPGRLAVRQALPTLRDTMHADVIIANAENAANGTGLTPEQYKRLIDHGVDGVTLGDHVFKKKQIVGTLERESNIIRPANLPRTAAGRGWMKIAPKDTTLPNVYVVTVLGRLFMGMPADNPFETVDRILAELPEANPIVLVEVHAEASSEKVAMGWYFNGRVTALFGTHTHIPTADAQVLPRYEWTGSGHENPALRTGYITDLGMSGPYKSVIGRAIDPVLKHMTTSMHAPFDVAADGTRVCGVMLDVDPATRHTTAIERIDIKADTNAPPFV